MRGEWPPDQAATAYQAELEAVLGAGGQFDLILLGIGADGHTASLFPGTAAMHEQTRWVVAHYVDKLSMWRITLTPVAINAAAHVTFIVSGAGKAERLREVFAGPHQRSPELVEGPDILPAQIVRPPDGRLLWLVDAAAAIHLREVGDHVEGG
jgi:6-phosphogluconolactonase